MKLKIQSKFLDLEAEHDPEELKYRKIRDLLREENIEEDLDKTDEELIDRNDIEFNQENED